MSIDHIDEVEINRAASLAALVAEVPQLGWLIKRPPTIITTESLVNPTAVEETLRQIMQQVSQFEQAGRLSTDLVRELTLLMDFLVNTWQPLLIRHTRNIIVGGLGRQTIDGIHRYCRDALPHVHYGRIVSLHERFTGMLSLDIYESVAIASDSAAYITAFRQVIFSFIDRLHDYYINGYRYLLSRVARRAVKRALAEENAGFRR